MWLAFLDIVALAPLYGLHAYRDSGVPERILGPSTVVALVLFLLGTMLYAPAGLDWVHAHGFDYDLKTFVFVMLMSGMTCLVLMGFFWRVIFEIFGRLRGLVH